MLGILILCNSCVVYAKDEMGGYSENGQVLITYTSSTRPAMEEINKGEGTIRPYPNTGDSGTAYYLKVMVITSAFLLMLIIYMKKGEQRNEKDEVYGFNGNSSHD